MYVNFGASLYMLVADGTKFFFLFGALFIKNLEKDESETKEKKFANFFYCAQN